MVDVFVVPQYMGPGKTVSSLNGRTGLGALCSTVMAGY